MWDRRLYEQVLDVDLGPSDFGLPVHGRVFAAISKLIERGDRANPPTLKLLFDQDVALATVGGSKYLVELAEAGVQLLDARQYAEQIIDLRLRRDALAAAWDWVTDLKHIDFVERPFSRIEEDFDRRQLQLQDRTGKAGPSPITNAIQSALETP